MMRIARSAKLLKEWLYKNHLTQEWLAGVLGTTQPTVYRWVTGEFRPDTHFRVAIDKLTDKGVPFDGWFHEDELELANRYKRKRARDHEIKQGQRK